MDINSVYTYPRSYFWATIPTAFYSDYSFKDRPLGDFINILFPIIPPFATKPMAIYSL